MTEHKLIEPHIKRQCGMKENKNKLHELVDRICDSGLDEYFIEFISLFLEIWGK